MVKKSVLEKLSDDELEKFILPNTRKTPEAIQLAYEILIERGKVFTQEEHQRIRGLYSTKLKEENDLEFSDRKEFDKQLTQDESAIALYTNLSILIISFLFGILYGFILATLNYFIMKKYGLGILLFIIGYFSFLFSGIILEKYFPEILNIYSFIRWIFSAFLSVLGLIIIKTFNNKFYPKDLSYRSRSITIPLVLIVIFYIVYINFFYDDF